MIGEIIVAVIVGVPLAYWGVCKGLDVIANWKGWRE